MIVLKVQLSSILFLVEVMRLTGMAFMVGHLVALKMNLSFFASLTRLCCSVRKMWGVNLAIHKGKEIIKLSCSSLFMDFINMSSLFLIDGLLPASQYVMKVFRKQCALFHSEPCHPDGLYL